jgi:excisionase family DNA binding protein
MSCATDRKATPAPLPRVVVTRHEAAELFCVGLRTVDTWIRDGRLRAVKVNRRVLIPVEAVRELLDEANAAAS